ncbi:hypothetical protein [Streptomyces sp. NPDC056707]|uniref:hypothetical protein n=1 Tax=Streptomyces sp. NPDC056707 TaxID=3345919 RepID=UPI003678A714
MDYSERTELELAHSVGNFDKQQIPGGVAITGSCPSCRHTFTYPIIFEAQLITPGGSITGQSAGRGLTDPAPKYLLRCVCLEDHPGRPADGSGCGAMAYINIKH